MKKRVFSVRRRLKEETEKVNTRCAFCGRRYDHVKIKPTVDHITPKSSGGATTIDNLLIICQVCNSVKKKSLSLQEFLKLNPECKSNIIKYLNKCKKININQVNYYESIKWIEKYL